MAWKYIDKVRTASGRWRYIYANARNAVNNAVARARLHLNNAVSNRNRLSVSYDEAQLGRNNGSGGSSSRSGGRRNGSISVSYDEAQLGRNDGSRRNSNNRNQGRRKNRKRASSNYVLRDGHAYQENRDRARRRIEHKHRKPWEIWK